MVDGRVLKAFLRGRERSNATNSSSSSSSASAPPRWIDRLLSNRLESLRARCRGRVRDEDACAPAFTVESDHNGGSRTEPKSGTIFPGEVCFRGSGRGGCVDLVGVGVRKKRIAIRDVDVYAVGLYLAKGSSLEPPAGVGSEEVLSECQSKAFRLEILYPRVSGKQISDSLSERIVPALSKVSTIDARVESDRDARADPIARTHTRALDRSTRSQARCSHHYPAFARAFEQTDCKFRKGSVIVFDMHRGQVCTFIDGRQAGQIDSPAISSAISSAYLGGDTVSKDLRADVISSLRRAMP